MTERMTEQRLAEIEAMADVAANEWPLARAAKALVAEVRALREAVMRLDADNLGLNDHRERLLCEWAWQKEIEKGARQIVDREATGRLMHESWVKTKQAQGFHGPTEECSEAQRTGRRPCIGGYVHDKPEFARQGHGYRCGAFHADMIPWEALPEAKKDINRHAFDALIEVIAPALARLDAHRAGRGECSS